MGRGPTSSAPKRERRTGCVTMRHYLMMAYSHWPDWTSCLRATLAIANPGFCRLVVTAASHELEIGGCVCRPTQVLA